MKRLTAIFISFVMIISVTGCDSFAGKNDLSNEESDATYLEYPEETLGFTVDKNGIVYISPVNDFAKVMSYNENGEKLEEFDILTGGVHLTTSDDCKMLYYSDIDTLYQLDLENNKSEKLQSVQGINQIKKIECVGEKIYILGISPDYVDVSHDLWDGGVNFQYDGTILLSYDINNNFFETVFDDLLINFAIDENGKIFVNAYDSVGGFYFAELDNSYSIKEKIYRNTGRTISFDVDEKGVTFFSLSAATVSTSPTRLYHSPLESNSGISEIYPTMQSLKDDAIINRNGYTYFHNYLNEGKISRIKNSVYVKENEKIKIISSSKFSSEVFSVGYSVDFNILDSDKFALTVLSRDKSYDLCYLSSRQDFASSIRDKGSFYPLNKVPYVKEFLENSFSYIQDAATDEDGNIWMIPIDINISCIMYNDENCKTLGINFSEAKDYRNILEILEKASGRESDYYFNGYDFIQKNTITAIRDDNNIDTEHFRSLAPALKEFAKGGYIRGSYSHGDFLRTTGAGPDMLFTSAETLTEQLGYFLIDKPNLDFIDTTGTSETSSAYCLFLCVNPDSKNLDTTLEYISAIAEYTLTQNDTFILSDKEKYTDTEYIKNLYKIYEDGYVDFNVSDEVFGDDFDSYMNGEIDLDTMISEANRKLDIYYNE